MKVGIITNDQSENLVDTIIVRQMLSELGVPVQEVVEGCFCCKFDELINQMDKILAHHPDILMGEPVGSCTDFVAAVANPIKIHYQQAFRFAPFSTLVDPDRARSLLLDESPTHLPEDVAYLFRKQLEEADLVVLNKIDLLNSDQASQLQSAVAERCPGKEILFVSAKTGSKMDTWLDLLLSGKPGAGTVLSQIDYDRYAHAEAVLGWLNSAVRLTAAGSLDAGKFLLAMLAEMRNSFQVQNAEIGHVKCAVTGGGRTVWANLTHLEAEPVISDPQFGTLPGGTLMVNARVHMQPQALEAIVRDTLAAVCDRFKTRCEIEDLQCFSPAYPNPPYLFRENVPNPA
jgi:Ni2+-binding GTPase involved in maturation of urease and hydrogenase